MKRFITRFLIFLTPLIIAYAFIEYRLSSIPNSYNSKRKLIEKQLKKIDVLVLGSSHAIYGINPAYFSYNGFNLANVWQTEYYDKRLTLKYIDKMPELKLVIIPISFFSFYVQIHDGPDEWRDYFYYHYWDIDYKKNKLLDPRRYSYIALYSLDVTKKMLLTGFKPLKDSIKLNQYGYATNDSSGHLKRISDGSGKSREELYISCYKASVRKNDNNDGNGITDIVNDIDEFIAILKDKKIKVAFVTTPAFHTFSDNCDKNILTMNDSIMHYLCTKYNTPYFNYFRDPRFAINDFADNDHLSTNGAGKFSKIIDSEVIRPVLGSK